jgi:hypothetical protein
LPTAADALLADASRVLCLGIGGGGDVAGTFALRIVAESFGTATVLGGLTWERRPIDPLPGARALDELEGAERLNEGVALARPQTTGPGGFLFAESRAAALTGEDVVLVDPNPGPAAVGDAIADAARRLACDVVALLDVGGDVLAHGDEPGLASPLADATLLAAHTAIEAAGVPTFGVVFGAGCDGELTPREVAERLGEVQDAGGDLGAYALKELGPLRAAVEAIPTEASAMALLCAEGETGEQPIRGGRRTVQLTPLGGELHCFSCDGAMRSAARLAAAVVDAPSLSAAHEVLSARGVRTELAYERDAAQQG